MKTREQKLEALVLAYRDAYGDLIERVDGATQDEFDATHGQHLDDLWAELKEEHTRLKDS